MKKFIFLIALLTSFSAMAQDERYTINPYVSGGTMSPDGYDNPYGNGANSAKIYDSQGNFRGNVNSNRYDPDSIANPYGRYGSRYSSDSIKNPYGAGSRYSSDSPYNPYGSGMYIQE